MYFAMYKITEKRQTKWANMHNKQWKRGCITIFGVHLESYIQNIVYLNNYVFFIIIFSYLPGVYFCIVALFQVIVAFLKVSFYSTLSSLYSLSTD